MKRNLGPSFLLAVGLLAGGTGASGLAADTAQPPDEIRALLANVRQGKDQTRSVLALAARDDAAPYLRLELAAGGRGSRDFADALRLIEARAFERTKARVAWWATTRRFDLCADAIVACTNDADAVKLASLTCRAAREVGAEAAARLNIPFGRRPGLILPTPVDGALTWSHLSGETVEVPRSFGSDGHTLARAHTLDVDVGDMNWWFAAVRSGVTYRKGTANEWLESVLLASSTVRLRAVSSSLIVCDGDVEFEHSWRHHAVIIANGDIRSAKGDDASEGTSTLHAAAGDIVLRKESAGRGTGNQFHAGGTVTLSGKPGPPDRVRDRQKELPFGVRFVDPDRDFGLGLEMGKGGLSVAKVADWSPFAKQGVRAGDVVVQIDDTKADSAATFRRPLRRGILRESVILHLLRDGKPVIRVVFLDGIPLPLAPPPREKK